MAIPGDSQLDLLNNMALEFASGELEGKVEDSDRFPYAPLFSGVLAKAVEMEFTSVMVPEDLGGVGEGITALCTVLNDISSVDASLGAIIFTCSLAQQITIEASQGELLRELLDSDGYKERLVACPSFCDPGDSPLDLQATREGVGFVLSGASPYLVLGGLAASSLVPARTSGTDGYSFFLVDNSALGVEISEPVLSLGLHACPCVDLRLNGARARLVGDPGKGDIYFRKAADRMSLAAASMATGIMKGSFDTAFAYTRQRRQGGREIVDWSEVRMILAGMAVDLRAAEMLVTRGCRSSESGDPGWELGARAAAIKVREMACGLTEDGIQLLGGNGYMSDYGQEKRFRDAKQVQSLLGSAPLRKLRYVRRLLQGEGA